MKKLFKFLSLFIVVSFLFACSSEDKINNETLENFNFDKHVAILKIDNSNLDEGNRYNGEQPIFLEILNFFENQTLESSYFINNVRFTDDGEFNDDIAGDGIYTSIETFPEDNRSLNVFGDVNISDVFIFKEELKEYIKQNNYPFIDQRGITIGCSIRLIPCPETSWWNTCWPLPSPCTCVEFYDCYGEISL